MKDELWALPTDLPGIIDKLREAAKNQGWNEHNLVMELCKKAEELHQLAAGCLGYFEWMGKQGSEFTPDLAWLAPLRVAVGLFPAKEIGVEEHQRCP